MKRRKHHSPITGIFNFFIGYKIFELALSIIILLAVYRIFPTPFHFFYNIINQVIK